MEKQISKNKIISESKIGVQNLAFSYKEPLKLKLHQENILQGIIFSEIFGKPKGSKIINR